MIEWPTTNQLSDKWINTWSQQSYTHTNFFRNSSTSSGQKFPPSENILQGKRLPMKTVVALEKYFLVKGEARNQRKSWNWYPWRILTGQKISSTKIVSQNSWNLAERNDCTPFLVDIERIGHGIFQTYLGGGF